MEKLRLLLDRLGLEEVKVGSVEEFQGQERLAIIISTVSAGKNFFLHVLKLLFSVETSKVNIKICDQFFIASWSALLRFYPGGYSQKKQGESV